MDGYGRKKAKVPCPNHWDFKVIVHKLRATHSVEKHQWHHTEGSIDFTKIIHPVTKQINNQMAIQALEVRENWYPEQP